MKKMALGRHSGIWAFVLAGILACMLSLTVSSAAFALDETTADSPTADNWASLNYDSSKGRTTKNDGRIWTDKSVYNADATVMASESKDITVEKSDDANFLVGLSALSSTMSVSGVADKPLDIILVLDVSGSMESSMGYSEVYADDMTYKGTYYIFLNGKYTEISYSYSKKAWYYRTGKGQSARDVYVTPKTSADDTTEGAVQVYRTMSKMEALEESVKSFISSTQEMNASISNEADMHRISLVKFSGKKSSTVGNNTYTDGGHTYNYSQVVKEFTTVTSQNASDLNSAVESLTPAGATRADNGLSIALDVTEDAREEAQTVVIFFTDGVPTSFSEWSPDVANDAIGYAKEMKDDGAWVYSVGVFESADPTGDGSLNNYMNAVSSNYPKATGYTENKMGARAEGDYYKTAEDSAGLAAIFAGIATQISGKVAEVPTHVEAGCDADKGGYVTFVDTLGGYMEVTSFNSVVFNGVEYKNQITAEAWNAADSSTDVFVSDAVVTNSLDEEVTMGSVIVTVERSADAATGDVITVKVPAALVPMAYYDLDIEDGLATTKRTPTTPIRAFYEVSLKDEASDLLANPDEDMEAYLATHTDENGKAVFYANAYDATKNAENGSTVATFIPSVTNDMYYATEDTLIFADEACTVPVTRVNESATYYYQRVYYIEGEKLEPQYETVSFAASVLKDVSYDFNEDGQLYVKAGTGRYTRADAFDTVKAEGANKTETAANASAPRWEDWNVAGSAVSVFLGNNGLLTCDVPGTLAVSKDVVMPSWSTADVSSVKFGFEVTLKNSDDEPIQGAFKAQVKNADGQKVGDAFVIETDSEGRADFELKDGQTLFIYGLPDKTMYTVRETNVPNGYRQTAPADDSGQEMPAKGMVYTGGTYTAAFENTYEATGTLVGADALKGTKTLEGRDWRSSDVFGFALAPEKASNPMPSNATEVDGVYMALETVSGADADKAFNFGNIVYTEPGTYLYDINEVVIEGTVDRVAGISYSQAVYEVTVKVTDNGHGTLEVESYMRLFGDDDTVKLNSADFTNTFDEDKVTFALEGLKHLEDTTGDYKLQDDAFTFQLTAKTEGAPMPEGTVDGVYTTTNKGVSVNFGPIDCTLSKEAIQEAGGEIVYSYEVKEIAGEVAGMTYDANTYQIDVTFTWDDTDGLEFVINYPDGSNNSSNNKWITFSNIYDPKDVVAEIEGMKYLKGRDWADGEKFTFKLQGLNGAPMPEAAQGASTYEFDVAQTDDKLNIGIFGQEIKYAKPGTYTYELSEVAGTAGGMTYDSYVSTITVTVTDGGKGKLVADVAYKTRTDIEAEKNAAVFVNTYESSAIYPGLNVEKTLYGRDMAFGEFDFTITAENSNAKAKGVAVDPITFESGAYLAGETCVMPDKLAGLTFNQDDAGKEFHYVVAEVLPEDDDAVHDGVQSNGVTYANPAEYYVVITPVDDGAGHLNVTTAVYDNRGAVKSTGDADAGKTAVVSFVNEYGFEDVKIDTLAEAFITKTFEGREWTDADTFEFQLKAITEGAPMPEGTEGNVATVAVGKPDFGNQATVDFGILTFAKAGTYEYEITEVVPAADSKLAGVTYDTHTATLTVSVTDNGKGHLVASSVVEAGAFRNSFETSVNYGATTTLDVAKSLEGRELRAHQFSFTVKPGDIPSMEKVGMTSLNGMEFRNGAPGEDGKSHMFSPNGIVFTQDDMGKTFTYIFAEIDGGEAGYTYDQNEYTIEMTPSLTEDHKVQVETVVKKNGEIIETVTGVEGAAEKPVVNIEFKNAYETEGAYAAIEGTKTMTGRGLTDGEFEFVLAYAADADKTPVATAVNSQNGSVIFEDQTYTLESLAELVEAGYAVKTSEDLTDVYTVNYIAFEKAGSEKGVTHTASTFALSVEVTDAGDGELTAEVQYPEGGLAFANTYSTGDPIQYAVKGLKVLDVPAGLSPESIEGKFTFTLAAATEGAPMPAVTEVTNDAQGNIDFGTIEFKQSDLDGADQVDRVRTKEFVYTVTETGSVAGVTNDTETKQFTLKLIDDGEGELTVWLESAPAEGPVFTFTNAYDADDVTESLTGEGNIAVTKTLEGRDMEAGEFQFQMVEGEEVVAEGSNDANGTVTFDAITFTEPGTHTYTVREVVGEKGGVTYDDATYQVEATVTDNGKGQLEVAWAILDEGVEEIAFNNLYDPGDLTLAVSAGKLLEGRDLKSGEFEFKLAAVTEDAPMPESDTVTNDAAGNVDFGEMVFAEPGTYEYEISEVAGTAEGVTYDDTVYPMTVVITDSGEGTLDVEVTFGEETVPPTFVNTYKAPEEPEDPSDPVDPNDGTKPGKGDGAAEDGSKAAFAKTNDMTGLLVGALVVMIAVAATVGIIARKRMN